MVEGVTDNRDLGYRGIDGARRGNVVDLDGAALENDLYCGDGLPQTQPTESVYVPGAIFNYDVFLSYKSEQVSWATRVAATLRGFGLQVYFEQDEIRAGDNWGPALEDAVRQSKAMLVLWSNAVVSDANGFVHQEVSAMNSLIKANPSDRRRFVPVSLDGTKVDPHPVLGAYQADNLSFAQLYQQHGDGGAAEVSAVDWSQAIPGIVGALQTEGVTEVRFVSAAMTRQQAEDLARAPAEFARDLAVYETVCKLMNQTASFDTKRYDASPDDWKPFPKILGDPSIREFVHEYDSAKRYWFNEANDHSRWLVVSYSDEVLSKEEQAWRAARERLREGPCLIVVDPVSLMHKDVFSRMMFDLAIQELSEACVIGVSPFTLRLHHAIRELVDDAESKLETFLQPAYDRFLSFFEAGSRICVLGVDHEYQFARWLQVAGDRIYMARKTPMRVRRRSPTRRFRREKGPDKDIRLMGRRSMEP